MKKQFRFCCAAAALVLTAAAMPPLTASADFSQDSSQTPYEVPDFSVIGAAGSLSAEETRNICEAVYHSVQSHQKQVPLANFGIDLTDQNAVEVIDLYRTVISSWDAGILVINGQVTYNTYHDTIQINYRFPDSEYHTQYNAYIEKLDAILAGVNPQWSDVEKALYLHDYIAVHYDYDFAAYYGKITRSDREQYSAFGMLKNGCAVCEGYSELYAILLHRLGIDAAVVTSDQLAHAWNILRIGGSWYHTDVTWDDSSVHYAGLTDHINFLRTAGQMRESGHDADDWVTSWHADVTGLAVPDTFSHAFWLETDAAILPQGGGWISVCGSEPCQLIRNTGIAADGTASQTVLCTLDESQAKWLVFDKPGYVWRNPYVVPAVIGDTVFYTTPYAVYALCGEQAVPVRTLTDAEQSKGFIYGLYAQGDTLYFGIDTKRRSAEETLEQGVPYYAIEAAQWQAALPAADLPYDLNEDRTVSAADAVALARCIAETHPADSFRFDKADLDADGILSLSDLNLLLTALQQPDTH